MCLVLLALQAHPDVELLLAGNRDEFHSRPSAPPAVWQTDPLIYAGRDLEAGGTWMGRSQHGVMAALTNRYGQTRQIPSGVRSRGEIVLELLGHQRPRDAAAWLATLETGAYRPFNVLFGDAARFYYFASEDGQPPRALAPGYYALSNSILDDESWPKVARSRRFFAEHRQDSGEELLAALQLFLGDSKPPDDLPSGQPGEEIHGNLGAVFIRSPDYGTVSSTILTSGGVLGERYYFAEGAALGTRSRGAFQLMEFPS